MPLYLSDQLKLQNGGTFPLIDSNAIVGGLHKVDKLSNLTSIDKACLKEGMLIYVEETDTYYKYKSNGTDALSLKDFNEFSVSDTSGITISGDTDSITLGNKFTASTIKYENLSALLNYLYNTKGSGDSGNVSLDTVYLWGQAFNGTSSVSGDLNNVNDINMSGDITLISDEKDSNNGNITTKNGTITAHKFVGDSANFGDIEATSGNINTLQTKNLITDYLTVLKLAHFFELVIDKIKSSGGAVLFTPADGFAVETANIITNENLNKKVCRLTWTNTLGDQAASNMWEVGDQAICQNFNQAKVGSSKDVQSKYFWALVVAVGYNDTEGYNFIDLSTSDYDGTLFNEDGSLVIEEGDEIVMLGHRKNSSETADEATLRQSAIYISSYVSIDPDLIAPLFCQYRGIDSFDLSGDKKYTWFAAGSRNGYPNSKITGSIELSDTQVSNIVNQLDTDGKIPYIKDGGWYIGDDYLGPSILNVTINSDGYWVIDGTTTTTLATGSEGHSPYYEKGDDGNYYWYVYDSATQLYVLTNIQANGTTGEAGESYKIILDKRKADITYSTKSESDTLTCSLEWRLFKYSGSEVEQIVYPLEDMVFTDGYVNFLDLDLTLEVIPANIEGTDIASKYFDDTYKVNDGFSLWVPDNFNNTKSYKYKYDFTVENYKRVESSSIGFFNIVLSDSNGTLLAKETVKVNYTAQAVFDIVDGKITSAVTDVKGNINTQIQDATKNFYKILDSEGNVMESIETALSIVNGLVNYTGKDGSSLVLTVNGLYSEVYTTDKDGKRYSIIQQNADNITAQATSISKNSSDISSIKSTADKIESAVNKYTLSLISSEVTLFGGTYAGANVYDSYIEDSGRHIEFKPKSTSYTLNSSFLPQSSVERLLSCELYIFTSTWWINNFSLSLRKYESEDLSSSYESITLYSGTLSGVTKHNISYKLEKGYYTLYIEGSGTEASFVIDNLCLYTINAALGSYISQTAEEIKAYADTILLEGSDSFIKVGDSITLGGDTEITGYLGISGDKGMLLIGDDCNTIIDGNSIGDIDNWNLESLSIFSNFASGTITYRETSDGLLKCTCETNLITLGKFTKTSRFSFGSYSFAFDIDSKYQQLINNYFSSPQMEINLWAGERYPNILKLTQTYSYRVLSPSSFEYITSSDNEEYLGLKFKITFNLDKATLNSIQEMSSFKGKITFSYKNESVSSLIHIGNDGIKMNYDTNTRIYMGSKGVWFDYGNSELKITESGGVTEYVKPLGKYITSTSTEGRTENSTVTYSGTTYTDGVRSHRHSSRGGAGYLKRNQIATRSIEGTGNCYIRPDDEFIHFVGGNIDATVIFPAPYLLPGLRIKLRKSRSGAVTLKAYTNYNTSNDALSVFAPNGSSSYTDSISMNYNGIEVISTGDFWVVIE